MNIGALASTISYNQMTKRWQKIEGDNIYMIRAAVALVGQTHGERSALDVVTSDPDNKVRERGPCDEALGELNPALQLQGVVILQGERRWNQS